MISNIANLQHWRDRTRWSATRAISLVILVCTCPFFPTPAKSQILVTAARQLKTPDRPDPKPDLKDDVVRQRFNPPGIQIPLEKASSTLRAVSSDEIGEIIQRTEIAHNSPQLARMDMIAEGTVTVSTGKGPVKLGVTLLRNGEHQSQHIFLQQSDGKIWDGKGEHLTAEGQRALEFLETQYARGLRQLLGAPRRDATTTDNGTKASGRGVTVQEKDGVATRYSLDSASLRMSRFEFNGGPSRDKSGASIPIVHAYAFSDYRPIDGVITPFQVEHDVDGVKQEELQWTRVLYLAATAAIVPPAGR